MTSFGSCFPSSRYASRNIFNWLMAKTEKCTKNAQNI
uniref:Uncharacterized protein n=1 Tax=Anguilla anguilla TaxID=7936 RepID=A0A0E9SZP3_ANGAN